MILNINLEHVLSKLNEALIFIVALHDHGNVHIIVLVVSFKQVFHDYILAPEQVPLTDIYFKPLVIHCSSFLFSETLIHLLMSSYISITL